MCNVHGSVVVNHLWFMVHNVLLVVCLRLVMSRLVAVHSVLPVVSFFNSHLLAVAFSAGVAAFNAGAVILSLVFSVLLCHKLCRHKHCAHEYCNHHNLFHNLHVLVVKHFLLFLW